MNPTFVFALIALGVAAIGIFMAVLGSDDTVFAGIVTTVLGGLVGLLLTVFSSATYVRANEVGIVTSFGQWQGTAESGLTWWRPWAQADTFPTRNQKSTRDKADSAEASNYNCVSVKMSSNASACVDATVLYTIDASNARKLWEGWKDFTKLNVDLINRATDDAFSNVYSGYEVQAIASKREEITEKITRSLAAKLGKEGVQLESVTLGDAHLPPEIQQRLNSVFDADLKVAVAQRAEEEAKAQARANAAQQQNLTPEAMYMACLATVREAKPQVFNCGNGATPPVILGGR